MRNDVGSRIDQSQKPGARELFIVRGGSPEGFDRMVEDYLSRKARSLRVANEE